MAIFFWICLSFPITIMSQQKNGAKSARIALISDTGGPAASATTFYYNIGSEEGGYFPTNSFGPGPQAVSKLVQGWKPQQLMAIGDLAYNAGGSTLQDISIGQFYNNFVYPYPPRPYLKPPYTTVNGNPTEDGQLEWPYNIFNSPKGFPNPVTGKRGGSPDRRNHFWGALGNHDYGMAIGYSQIGLTPYDKDGNIIGPPIGPSSATSVQSSIDYFMPYLEDPSLLGPDSARLNVGSVDKSGNRGAYYSVSFGGTADYPLIEFFNLDTERLNINAGFEDWNPSGQKVMYYDTETETWKYKDEVSDDKDYSIGYDPSDPESVASPGTTTDPNNGYDQYEWLKQSLADSKADWKVVTGHHPVYASGRWSDDQPDDHMSNLYMQRLLAALPDGAFDAYYNGHDHYYERVLEGKVGGIGLGIPFITNGNSGRNLSKKIQVPYGDSVYEPTDYKGSDDEEDPAPNPNERVLEYLLDSNPIEVGSSGLAGSGDQEKTNGFSNGKYGYGFGATKLDAKTNYLLFRYEEAPIVDPAIANHLKGGKAVEKGFKGTTASDWIPNPGGSFEGKADLATFKLDISDGVVTGVTLLTPGRGYMTSKGGNYTVKGFNVYGNNVNPLKPWLDTAQVDLTFSDGGLSAVALTDGGKGYQLVVQSAAGDNTATSTADLPEENPDIVVALDYRLDEIQYLVRDPNLYNDFYMITDSKVNVELIGKPGAPGMLRVSAEAASKEARKLLDQQLQPTTGYSGSGSQTFSSNAQDGDFVIYRHGEILAQGNLDNGSWVGPVDQLPKVGEKLQVEFSGDPITSYNLNFKPFSGTTKAVRGKEIVMATPTFVAEPDPALRLASPLVDPSGFTSLFDGNAADWTPFVGDTSGLTV